MLKYLVVLLDDSSISYCHYHNSKESNLMPLETLKKGILFAMKNDLKIQYVLPDFSLPEEYIMQIDSMFHDNIGSLKQDEISSAIVIDDISELHNVKDALKPDKRYIVRTNISGFISDYVVVKDVFSRGISVNIVFTDVESFGEEIKEKYETVLNDLKLFFKNLIIEGLSVNTNLLTDRIALDEMNNCGAGDTTITLAPNGKLYPCPAFYYDNDPYCEGGNIDDGLNIRNRKLFTLDCAPLCKRCDAYQCKRCVWLNKKLTYEVNIPSRQQCVMAHLERNASKALLDDFHEMGLLAEKNIEKIDYIDPFDEFQGV